MSAGAIACYGSPLWDLRDKSATQRRSESENEAHSEGRGREYC